MYYIRVETVGFSRRNHPPLPPAINTMNFRFSHATYEKGSYLAMASMWSFCATLASGQGSALSSMVIQFDFKCMKFEKCFVCCHNTIQYNTNLFLHSGHTNMTYEEYNTIMKGDA